MALTKIITNTIDLSSDTTGLKIPKGTSTSNETIQYLVVAGGGGGSGNSSGGGGGGAGGLLSGTTSVALGTNVNVTIGSGGAATYLGATNTTAVAGSGGNSTFSTVTATGGGGAANTGASSSSDGGSGAGAPGGTAVTAGSGTSGEGNDGGIGSNPSDIGGGGGGAGGVGQPGGTRTGATDGQGGVALANSITGASILYAGGGGGGVADLIYNSTPATAGLGGGGVSGTGGDGGQSDDGVGSNPPLSVWGYPGVPNTGGGGGGGSRSGGSIYVGGGAGGSGTVILRYPTINTLTVGSGLYGNYSTGTTGLCHWPTTSNGISLFQLNNNITDTCGTSTASWSGTPAYSTTAKFGSHSAEFSGGGSGTYIDTGVDPDSYSNWTVSFWMYRTNTAAYDLVLGSTDYPGFYNGWGVGFYNQASSGKFDVYLRNASGNVWRTMGGSTKFNTWEHVALTYDSSGSGTTTIYHNGKLLEGITYGSNPATGSISSNAYNWHLGSAGVYNQRLEGNMDQARFYDRVLTAQEIELLYAETSDPTTGVIGSETWSKFLGGTGTVSFLDTGTGTGRPPSPDIGTMRENTTTGKMEIYTGTKGWRALQQTGQDVGVVPSNNFNTVLYAGDGATTQLISGVGFEAGFTWIKDRDVAENHALFDIVRGANEWLHSNNEDAQTTYSGNYGLLSWNNDGFVVGNGTAVNDSGENYVAWNWKASDSFSYPASGSGSGSQLASSGYKNVAAGFSMVKYTGVISSKDTRAVQHGLGGVPEIIISKEINRASTRWVVRTQLIDDSPYAYLVLNGTDALQQFNGSVDGTLNLPTTSVFDINWNTSLGTNGYDIIAYCFRSIPGYSLMGTYTGTGSATESPIIYTGFEPGWIMIKNTDNSSNSWGIADNKRNTSNPRNLFLFADWDGVESTTEAINFYNNGFQIRSTSNFLNQAGNKMLFMCFAS